MTFTINSRTILVNGVPSHGTKEQLADHLKTVLFK